MRFLSLRWLSLLLLLPLCLHAGAREETKNNNSEAAKATIERMEKIVVPVLPNGRDMTLAEMVAFLAKAGRENLPAGVAPVVIKASPALKKVMAKEPPRLKKPDLPPRLVMQLRNLSLLDTCNFVCDIANLKFVVRDGAVILTLPRAVAIPE